MSLRVRGVPHEAAQVMLKRSPRFCGLKALGDGGGHASRMQRAKVALARKLATVLHRMLVYGSDFRAIPHSADRACDIGLTVAPRRQAKMRPHRVRRSEPAGLVHG